MTIRVGISALEYSMSVKLLTEHCMELLSLKGGFTGSPESTLVKIQHCWKSCVTAKIVLLFRAVKYQGNKNGCILMKDA